MISTAADAEKFNARPSRAAVFLLSVLRGLRETRCEALVPWRLPIKGAILWARAAWWETRFFKVDNRFPAAGRKGIQTYSLERSGTTLRE